MRLQHKPRIQPRETSSGKYTYYVDCGKRNNQRKMIKCANYKEAQELQEKIFKERLKNGNKSVFEMTDLMKSKVMYNLKLLEEYGADLDEAVKFYLKFSKPKHGTISIDHAITYWKESKETEGRRSYSIKKAVDSFYRPFAAHFGGLTLINDLNTADIEKYLNSKDTWSAQTFTNHKKNLSILFNFLINKGYCTINPIGDNKIGARIIEHDIKLLSPEDMKKALQYCLNQEHYYMMAALTLVAFCGVRNEQEVQKLDWSNIDLEANVIHMSAKIAKKSCQRHIAIPRIARFWLNKVPDRKGKVIPVTYEGRKSAFTRLWKKTGIDYPQNALRHCFGSYHYNKYENYERTSQMMGHPHNGRELISSYYELCSKADANKYWRIVPDGIEEELKEAKRKELIAELYQKKAMEEAEGFYSKLEVDETELKLWGFNEGKEEGSLIGDPVADYAPYLENFDIFAE